VKEKVLAAHRAGVKHVILPKENEKDLPDIPAEVRQDIEIAFVEHAEEVVDIAFPGLRSDVQAAAVSAALAAAT
jgi:ATP-dependent Lon protease